MEKDNIPEIAQRLYEEDGYAGNLYRQQSNWERIYEEKAQDLLEKLNPKKEKHD